MSKPGKNDITCTSTARINIEGMPEVPYMGYYNRDILDNSDITKSGNITNPFYYSNDSLVNNLKQSCLLGTGEEWAKTQGIYSASESNVSQYLPNGKDEVSLNIPFYLAKAGVLTNGGTNTPLKDRVNEKCSEGNTGVTQLTNQIQYLTCQLEQERNRNYSSDDFNILTDNDSIKTIFEKFSNIKLLLVIVFGVTIYLFINGFFGSLDFCSNVFTLIESKSSTSVSYWSGVLAGIALPFVVLVIAYSFMVCKNLKDLEKEEITEDPYGVMNEISSELKSFDVITLILFLFLMYALVAVLFTVKKSLFGPVIYSIIICAILVIISVLLYILYAYIPFFNTSDSNKVDDRKDLRLFIDGHIEPSRINTNQQEDRKIRQVFIKTFVVIAVLSILFFKVVGNNENTKNDAKSAFVTGLLSSCAILVLPGLWVINLVLAINLFYVYPIIIMLFRFIRYIVMAGLYVATNKSPDMKDSFSDDLVAQLDNFKDYSPSWGLIGVHELKLVLNMMGYNNLFSKEIFPDEENGANISANKFFASGLLGSFVQVAVGEESNTKGIAIAVIHFILTIIVCAIVLYGVVRVQDI
jgi:hypothetical protein